MLLHPLSSRADSDSSETLDYPQRNDSTICTMKAAVDFSASANSGMMAQMRQNEPAQSTNMLPPTPERLASPPLSHVDPTQRQSRYQRLMAALRPQSSTDAVTITTNNVHTSTAHTAAPAQPQSASMATANTIHHSHNLGARLHRLLHRSHHHPRSHHHSHRLFSSLSIPRSLHHHNWIHHDSNNSSPKSAHHFARSHSHSSYDGGDYDPYTVRGTTPPPAGPRDFAATSQQSGVWRRGQRRERRPEPDDDIVSSGCGWEGWARGDRGGGRRRRRRGSPSTSMSSGRSPTVTTSTMTSDDDDELAVLAIPVSMSSAFGRGYGYQESWEVDVHASGRVVGMEPHQQGASHRLHGPRPPPSRHGQQQRRGRRRSESGSANTLTTASPPQQQPATSFNLSFNRGGPGRRRSRSVMASHASSEARSGSASSVYSRGTRDDDDDDDDDGNAEDEADGADTGVMPSRPRPPSASRSHSHASSVALRRWESSHPGSPYPSPFRPGLAALSRPRSGPAPPQQTERKRRHEGRVGAELGSAGAAASAIADDDGEDDAYAEALAGSAMASTPPPPLIRRSRSWLRECEGADTGN